MAVSTDHNWAPSRSPSNTTTLSGQTVFVGYGSDTPTKMVPSVSTTKSERLWVKALEEWRDELDARDYRLMKQTPNFNALQRSIQLQKRIYKERTIPRLLDRLSPFLTRLKTFTSVFDTCAQADKIGCIIWGSMKLVIDVNAPLVSNHWVWTDLQ